MTSAQTPTGPLDGLRVVELATVIMAPYAGQILGDLGADVIKVEHGPLDSSRLMGGGKIQGLSGVALNLHRNKRSISLDLKSVAGARVLRALLRTADVFITNLRPAPLERLGLRYEDLRESMPRLIYCESHGFESGTDEENAPVYDDIIQALTGLPSLNHEVLGATAFLPALIGDKVTGVMISNALLAALVHRERTGEAQKVEIPMFDAVLSFNLVEHLAAATIPGSRAGYSRIMSRRRGPHQTSDGYVAIMPYTDEHWKVLFEAVGREDILERPWFAGHGARLRDADRVFQDLADIVIERTTAEWLDLCARLNIPASPVPTINEIVNDPKLHRGVLRDESHPLIGPYRHIESPMKFSSTPTALRRSAPLVGEQTVEILLELGFSENELDELLREDDV
ncbi:MAG TPA: CoA transferase [Acidimicrobiales bacterium]|nr:CoA transferase [Acidimicrobiales bacterium]